MFSLVIPEIFRNFVHRKNAMIMDYKAVIENIYRELQALWGQGKDGGLYSRVGGS